MENILTVTGHRPQKIGKDLYNWATPLASRYIKFFMDYILLYTNKNGPTLCRSGAALGVDTMFAIAVLRLRKAGYQVKLECCIPCEGHSSKWNVESRNLYNKILKDADAVTYVSKEPYTAWCMQDRNMYMVDNGCNLVLGIWDGTKGGTGNCIEYAKKQGVPTDTFTPEQIEDLVGMVII